MYARPSPRIGVFSTLAPCSSAISAEAKAKFLPDSEYARAKAIDYGKMAEVQKAFSERYLKEVQ